MKNEYELSSVRDEEGLVVQEYKNLQEKTISPRKLKTLVFEAKTIENFMNEYKEMKSLTSIIKIK